MTARILLAAVGVALAGSAWAQAPGGWEVTLLWPGKLYEDTGQAFQRLGPEVYATLGDCEAAAERVRPRLPAVRLRCDPI